MDQFLQIETLVIELLLVASLVAMAVQRLRVPYTVALVVVGLLITFQAPLNIQLAPSLILMLFIPPLVFEAALHLDVAQLGRSILAVLALAVPGVILTMLIVGGLIAWLTPVGLSAALVFGALIAATDPVAVVALFRRLSVPKRLAVLLESESLLNDGSAIVLFNLAVASALTGHFSIIGGLADFVRVAAGGLVVGSALAWLVSQLIARVDDYLIETTFTTAVAFGAYLVAENLHFSGVLAVVAAGLVCGNLGLKGMSPTTRIVLHNFWEYVAFLANSLVFLLIGLQVKVPALLANWRIVVVAIGIVLVARIVVVYGINWIVNHWAETAPLAWQHVMAWGGLRGAIGLALALSLPAALGAERGTLQVMTFGVVLFTLLVQATSIRLLVSRLGLAGRSRVQEDYEASQARLTALRAADARLDHLHSEGLLSSPTWERLKPIIGERVIKLASTVRDILRTQPDLEAAELDAAWREALRAQRASLLALRREGMISADVFDRLSAEVDVQLSAGFADAEPATQPATQFIDVTLGSDSPVVGRNVSDLALPRAAVLVSIRRGDEVIIPRGDTRLNMGDTITALVERDQAVQVVKLLKGSGQVRNH